MLSERLIPLFSWAVNEPKSPTADFRDRVSHTSAGKVMSSAPSPSSIQDSYSHSVQKRRSAVAEGPRDAPCQLKYARAQIFGVRKLESVGCYEALFIMILCLAFLVEHRRVMNGQTNGQTHGHSIYRASIASRNKNNKTRTPVVATSQNRVTKSLGAKGISRAL